MTATAWGQTPNFLRDTSVTSVCVVPGQGRDDPECPRCAVVMIWTKASWHCPSCRYKEGCCG
ncbi:MAG TPA: hypothetical protein VHI30_12430 [Gaiellales bacterium]|nr:hypothetical protein [Gaiellales bacterium]